MCVVTTKFHNKFEVNLISDRIMIYIISKWVLRNIMRNQDRCAQTALSLLLTLLMNIVIHEVTI